MSEKVLIVVPWHNPEQLERFQRAWWIYDSDDRFLFVQDTDRSGCAKTKNRGVQQAVDKGADVVIILDDDCFPEERGFYVKDSFIESHLECLQPQYIELFRQVTTPPSRGTPYMTKHVKLKVAASMGFWTEVGDYDACGQLVHGARTPMKFEQQAIHGQYFPLCGMNLAFRPKEWWPWCQFIDVPRFDDIWQGWLWQKEAYRRGYCFNLNGPLVRHSRQSNVWQNLRDEAVHLERNETLWSDIAASNETEYDKLRALLPV